MPAISSPSALDRDAPHGLRRLAIQPDEGTAHALRIRESDATCDGLDRLRGAGHLPIRDFGAQALHRLRGRFAGLSQEEAAELPRAHMDGLREPLDGQRLVEM